MEQIKPVVIGYKQIEWKHSVFNTQRRTPYSKEAMIRISISDLKLTGIKSKFRPVYEVK